MANNVISMFEKKKKDGCFCVTDEWLDYLGQAFLEAKKEDRISMTFEQWVEWKTMRYL